jgi:hypothetical protein
MWISFQEDNVWKHTSRTVPFAIRIYAGGVNVVSGEPMRPNMSTFLKSRNGVARKQDYIVHPEQDWIDGAAISPGVVRQFVAVPYGSGHSIEKQVTGFESVGGFQIEVIPATGGMRISVSTFRDFYIYLHPDDTIATLIETIAKRDGYEFYWCSFEGRRLKNGE